MSELPPTPVTNDLSFDHNGIHTIFRITNFQGRKLIVLSNLGKIGHIIEVFFPKMIGILGQRSSLRCDYECKLILGTDCSDFDLMIKRMAMVYHEYNFEDNIILYLGLHDFNIDFCKKVIDIFTEHLESLRPNQRCIKPNPYHQNMTRQLGDLTFQNN
uniref:Proteasome assembly chaperone 3 n=1 Tax=Strongyloides papillosus TaxID=174720 RepID=A0A0N5CAD0_STREA